MRITNRSAGACGKRSRTIFAGSFLIVLAPLLALPIGAHAQASVGAGLAPPTEGAASGAPTTVISSAAAAQQSEVLLPAQSAEKAKAIIQKAIQALGGPAYLGIRDISCSGRFAQFDRNGKLGGYARFWDYTKLPDKNRTEYFKQRNIIQVRTAQAGWDMDRGGVVDAPADDLESYQESLKKDIHAIFRSRLNEEGMVFRYGGPDIVDLKQVDWVEIMDRDRRSFRIAMERATSLPIRAEITTRNPRTRERTVETYYLSNYHPVGGVTTALQEARERNGRKVYQVFIDECQYNTGLSDSLFTRESLEQRFAELNKGKKKK